MSEKFPSEAEANNKPLALIFEAVMWDLTSKSPFKYIKDVCPASDILFVPNSNLGEVSSILPEPVMFWRSPFPYNAKLAPLPVTIKLCAMFFPLALFGTKAYQGKLLT